MRPCLQVLFCVFGCVVEAKFYEMWLLTSPFLVARLCSVSCGVSANLTDVEGAAVGATDLMNGSLSVPWFVFVCDVSQ